MLEATHLVAPMNFRAILGQYGEEDRFPIDGGRRHHGKSVCDPARVEKSEPGTVLDDE
jgi:hypothetical protein